MFIYAQSTYVLQRFYLVLVCYNSTAGIIFFQAVYTFLIFFIIASKNLTFSESVIRY